MKPQSYKRTRCEKRYLSKCIDGPCKTYNVLESKFADMLNEDDEIIEIRCQVPLEGLDEGKYCSDFVCVKADGDLMVRECVWRKDITKKRTLKLLDLSRNYWLRHGVEDWGIVVDKKKEETDAKENAD